MTQTGIDEAGTRCEELYHTYDTRRFAPRASSAARYARSQGRIARNANEADREVHGSRCKLTTCKCQELHARGYQPDAVCMYLARNIYTKKAKKFRKFPNKKYICRQLQAEKGWEVGEYTEGVLRSRRDLSKSIRCIDDMRDHAHRTAVKHERDAGCLRLAWATGASTFLTAYLTGAHRRDGQMI